MKARPDGALVATSATIAVCTQPASTGTQPCSPLATLYTDATLGTPCTGTLKDGSVAGATNCSNPLVTDARGNYHFYAAGGPYTLQVYGSGLTTSVEPDIMISGAVGSGINGEYVVGTAAYPTIQSAITAADTGGIACGPSNLCGTVLIPAKYAGTDIWTNGNGVLIKDQRSNLFVGNTGIAGTASMFVPTFVTTLAPSNAVFPQGSDLNFLAAGPAALYFRKSTVATTTTASLTVSANTNVLIGAVNNQNIDLGNITTGNALQMFSIATGQKMMVGRGTANKELLTYSATPNCPTTSTWNIVDGVHLCLNTANTHAGTTAIEQIPDSTRFDWANVQLRADQVRAPTDATNCLMMEWDGSDGNPIFFTPTQSGCAAPANNFTFANGRGVNFFLTNTFNTLPVPTTWQTLGLGGLNGLQLNNTDQAGVQRGFVGPFAGQATNIPSAASEVLRLANGQFVAWRNNANTDDNYMGVNASDGLTYNTRFNLGGGITLTFPVVTDTVATIGTTQTFSVTQKFTAGITPTTAGGADLGTTALPFGNLWLGTAATNNFKFQPAATAAARVISIPDPLAATNLGLTFNATNGFYQSKRGVAGCTTGAAAGNSCGTDITVTWGTAFADANYSVTCTGSTPTNVPSGPFVVSASKLAATVHINYFAITAAAASYATIDCIAVHD